MLTRATAACQHVAVLRAGVLTAVMALLLAGCGSGTGSDGATDAATATDGATNAGPSPSATPAVGQLIEETVAAPSLANTTLGDAAERDVLVYLPPSYATSTERYPVVYFLAGFQERVGAFRSHSDEVWAQMVQPGKQEMIVVEVDGSNRMGGNFYANSPVTGNAEDALTTDLVSYIDATYRTIPEASARGLSGFSMGGSGTVNVGLAHPDVFGALYANSPGLLDEESGLEEMLADNGEWAAYGMTFAPDPGAEPPMLRIDVNAPLADQDPVAVAAWASGYGNLRQKVADYLAGPDRLAEVRISYGTSDQYTWITSGSAWFVDLLEASGVPVSEHVFGGGHSVDPFFFDSDFVDFFSSTLTGADAA